MNWIQSLVAFLGRALISVMFIGSGVCQILTWLNTEQYYTQELVNWLAISIQHPFIQSVIEFGLEYSFVILTLAVIFQLVGGLLVFLGLWVRFGALLLIFFLIPTTIAFHHFWEFQGVEKELQMIHFIKNVSILGGLLVVLALGKGCQNKKSDVEES